MSKFHAAINRKRWAALRRRVLDAANWRCRSCNKYANEVDHVVALMRGGDAWEKSNLQALCRNCHIEKTSRENQKPDPARDAWRELVARTICADSAKTDAHK